MLPDFRLALRQLRRTPGFTALVIIALALGIGASTAIFSVINAALLKPLPFAEPDSLVRLWAFNRARNITRTTLSYVRFDYIRQRQQSFSEIVAAHDTMLTLTGRGQAEQLPAKLVSARFFDLFGISPLHGRTFLDAEDQPGARPVALISERLWRRLFQGDPAALGAPLTLDGQPYTLIGVVPEDFNYPYGDIDLWVTRLSQPALYSAQQVNDGAAYLNPTARLKPGVSLREAREEIERLVAAYHREFPQRIDAVTEVELLSFKDELSGQQRQAFYLLMGAVGFVHLIACFNVANLLLARFTARSRENAMRLALGASPARLVAQFVAESMLLAAAAGVAGTVLAHVLLRIFRFGLNEFLPRAVGTSVDPGALLFMLGLTAFTGLAVGIFPGMVATRRDLLDMLKESARGATQGLTPGSFRRALLVAEIAFSLVLLIAAGLVALSFARLQRVDPGYRTRGVFLVGIDLPRASYATEAQQAAVAQQILERVAVLPGVQRVALTDSPPLLGAPILSPYAAADRPLPPMNERLIALRNIITPGYFESLGIPLQAGRDFTADDRAGDGSVAVLNATMAKQLFPNEDPLGRRVVLGITNRTAEVIGIVADVRGEGLATPPKPEIYFSFHQRPRRTFTLAVRTEDQPGVLVPALRAVLREIDPDIPLISPRGLDSEFRNSIANERFSFRLLGLFAGTALVLALLGIYSVMAYTVQQRAPEIGIRLLLGASAGAMRGMIVRDGARLTLVGILIGLAGAYFFSELLRRLLFDVPPVHVPAYLAIAVSLTLVSLLTCWLAARRVAAIDPLEVVKTD